MRRLTAATAAFSAARSSSTWRRAEASAASAEASAMVVLPVVDLEEHVAGLDRGVLADRCGDDGAGNLWADGDAILLDVALSVEA